jgi:restriction system protein
MTNMWLVRAGERGGAWETDAAQSVAAIGWHEVGDLSAISDREAISVKVREAYPSASAKQVSSWTGTLHRFRQEITIGDLGVTPLRQTNTVAVGEVVGDYAYRPDLPKEARQTRPVRWLRVDLARMLFGQDLLYSLGSLLTVARITRNDAARRIAYLAEHERDPGAAITDPATEQEPEPASIDLERLAYDRINTVHRGKLLGP